MVGGLVSRAPSRAAAATSRSACSRRNPKRTRSAPCSSSTSPITCCGRGRGFSSASASLIVYPQLSDIQRPSRISTRSCSATTSPIRRCCKFLPAGFDRADGRRPDRREFLDHPHASELGRVVSGPRLLPPLHRAASATSSTTSWPGASPPSLLVRASSALVYVLDTAQGHVRPHSADRRGHGPALFAALVLVAHQRVVRDRRDDQLVRRLARLFALRSGARDQHRPRAAHHDRDDDGLLGRHGVPRPPNRPRRLANSTASAAVRPGWEPIQATVQLTAAGALRGRATIFRSRCSAGSPAAP